jgi:hypothetical protein
MRGVLTTIAKRGNFLIRPFLVHPIILVSKFNLIDNTKDEEAEERWGCVYLSNIFIGTIFQLPKSFSDRAMEKRLIIGAWV